MIVAGVIGTVVTLVVGIVQLVWKFITWKKVDWSMKDINDYFMAWKFGFRSVDTGRFGTVEALRRKSAVGPSPSGDTLRSNSFLPCFQGLEI